METIKPVLILLLCEDTQTYIPELLSDEYEFYPISNIQAAVKTLQNIRYDLVLLDHVLFGKKTGEVVRLLKHSFPSIPLMLMLDDAHLDDRSELMNVGIDAICSKQMPVEELNYQIQMLMNQYRQNRSLVRLSRKLHVLASLAPLLHEEGDADLLILQFIKLMRTTLQLYGVVVILRDGDIYRLSAGSEEISNRNELYRTVFRPQDNDPFVWSIRNCATQLYDNIAQNPNYNPLPILRAARGAVVIPLSYQNAVLGAVGIFVNSSDDLLEEDVLIYEQLGAELISALHKADYRRAQSVKNQSSQHLLRAWQKFASLSTAHEIATALCALVEEVPNVGQAYVWIAAAGMGTAEDLLIDQYDGKHVSVLLELHQRGMFQQLMTLFLSEIEPVILDRLNPYYKMFHPLLIALKAQQVIVVPIADGSNMLGCLMVEISDEDEFVGENTSLIVNLTNTAAAILVRSTLIARLKAENKRLETILHSISEGIFFVDDKDCVVFCNPQVAKLTSLRMPKLINQSAKSLLAALAQVTNEPNKAEAQLEAAYTAVTQVNKQEEYPIIELSIGQPAHTFIIEFARIEPFTDQPAGWMGVIYDANTSSTPHSQLQDLMVTTAAESLRVPLAQIRSLVSTLSEQHGHFNYRERDQLLTQAKSQVEMTTDLWNNFLEVYSLQTGAVTLNPESINVVELIQRIASGLYQHRRTKEINYLIAPGIPPIKADEFRLERAISNVLKRALAVSPEGSTLTVKVERNAQEVTLIIQDAGATLAPEYVAQLFSPTGTSNGGSVDYGLYIARELVNRHGGRVWAENNADRGTAILMALPLVAHPASSPIISEVNTNGRSVDTHSVPSEVTVPAARPASRAPTRTPHQVLFLAGQSDLGKTLLTKLEENYEVLVYQSIEDAVANVTAIHMDLIVVDANLKGADGIEGCVELRKRSEAPMLLVADKISDRDKVRGLNAGADDVLSKPISDSELAARIQVIFKRQSIPVRTSEPLRADELFIDFARREVFLAGKPVELTRIEYDLLYTMVANRGQILTHKQLLEKVWGPDYTDETHYLWVNISRLRKKLESKKDGSRYIHTQSGVGYLFDIPK